MSKTPGRIKWVCRPIGADNEFIYQKYLGLGGQKLKELKEKGLWGFGTAAEGDTLLYMADLRGPTVIVIGSEGAGMGRLVRESCDVCVKIPMRGKISSLNASAAAAVLLYEVVRQRTQY
jgi:23S rRNA (guanosine2251-2'-O)-methyltransferase